MSKSARFLAILCISLCLPSLILGQGSPSENRNIKELETSAADNSITAFRLKRPEGAFDRIVMYKGELIGVKDGAIYRSSNLGTAWELVIVGVDELISSQPLVVESNWSTFRSRDNGATWSIIALPEDDQPRPNPMRMHDQTLFTVAQGALFSSQDFGDTWHKRSKSPCPLIESMQFSESHLFLRCEDYQDVQGQRKQLYISDEPFEEWKLIPFKPDDGDFDPNIMGVWADKIIAKSFDDVFMRKINQEGEGDWANVTPPHCHIDTGELKIQIGEKSLFVACEEKLFIKTDKAPDWEEILFPMVISGIYSSSEYLVVAGNAAQKPMVLVKSIATGKITQYLTSDFVETAKIEGSKITAVTSSGVLAFDLQKLDEQPIRIRHVLPGKFTTITVFDNRLNIAGHRLHSTTDVASQWEVSLPPVEEAEYRILSAGITDYMVYGNGILYSRVKGVAAWHEIKVPPRSEPVALCSSQKTLYGVFAPGLSTSVPNYIASDVDGSTPSKARLMALDSATSNWTLIRDLPYATNGVKSLQGDNDGFLYVATPHFIDRGVPQGEWLNVLSGVPASNTIRQLLIDDNDNLILATDRGLFWSADHGLHWKSPEGRGASGPDIKSVQRVDEKTWLARTSSNPLLIVNKLELHAEVDSVIALEIPENGDAESVTLDGTKLDRDAFNVKAGEVKLRTQSSQVKNLDDGIHKITVKVKGKLQEMSLDAYIYMEAQHAKIFKPYGRSFALVVSASGRWDSAHFPNLDQAEPQAHELSKLLTAQGFEVKELSEATSTNENITAYLSYLAKTASPQDRVLIYFSGHGVSIKGALGQPVGYLLTYPATADNITQYGFPMSRLKSEYAALINAKHVLFLLDTCFSGLALKKAPTVSQTDLKDFLSFKKLQGYTASPARDILVASQGDQSALDIHGGLFTSALLKGLNGDADYGKDGVITIEQLAVYVSDVVGKIADAQVSAQRPQLEQLREYGDGQFVFYRMK